MMFQTRLWAAALIIVLVIIAGFALSVPRAREVRETSPASQTGVASTTAVTLHDSYKKGVHTITGSVLAPDACTSVSPTATLADDSRIHLELSMPQDTGLCLVAPTKVPFSVSVTAPAGTAIDVRVNGTSASTTKS